MAAAQDDGKLDDEIVPLTATKSVFNKETKETTLEEFTLRRTRATGRVRRWRGWPSLQPVKGEGHCITAGNACQLSDGASACLLMDSVLAEKRGLQPLGIYRGMAVAGVEPDEMGIGPAAAVPKLMQRTGKKVGDIDLWELNEAFAVQVIYCQEKLGIPIDAQRERRCDCASAIRTA